jgi:hypothetical protein
MINIKDLARITAQSAPQLAELLSLSGQGHSSSEVAAICRKKIEPVDFTLACVGLGYVDIGFTNPILCITGANLFREFLASASLSDLQNEEVALLIDAICQGTFIRVQECLSQGNTTLTDSLSDAVGVLHEQLKRLELLQQAGEFGAVASWDKADLLADYLKVRSYFRTRLKYGCGGIYFHQNGLINQPDFEERWAKALELRNTIAAVCKSKPQAQQLLALFRSFLLEERASCEGVLHYILYSGQAIPSECVEQSELEAMYAKCLSLRHAINQVV